MYESRQEREALFAHTGKYTELRLLNDEPTGFGWAVLVQDNYENNRRKVIKLPNREATTQALLNEAGILSRISQFLRHPHLIELGSVECYRISWQQREEQRWFIVLQYGGTNLRTRLGRLGVQTRDGREEYTYRDGRPLALAEALDIAIQITDGLRALHEFEESPGQHIVHRDIKPENILIDEHGRARLTDFGISKVVERLTQSLTVAGTLPYLAPEYSTGRLTAASDLYSLGIVFYEMFTGRFPFEKFEDRFYAAPRPPHEVNPSVPESLSDIVLRMLAYDRSRPREEEAGRYQSAAEVLADLRRCQSRLHPVPPQFHPVAGAEIPRLYRNTLSRQYVQLALVETDRPLVCLGRLDAALRIDLPNVTKVCDAFYTEELVGIASVAKYVPPAEPSVPAADVETYRQPLTSPTNPLQSLDGLATIGPAEALERLQAANAAEAVLPPTISPGIIPPCESSPLREATEFKSPAVGFPAFGSPAVEAPVVDGPAAVAATTYEGAAAYEFAARIRTLCEQLSALHRLGLYHGFLTPETVRWEADSWVIDGIWMGRLVGASRPESLFEQFGIDPADLPPEVLRWDSPPTLSADLYGIGCLLHRGLTGRAPLDRDSALSALKGSAVSPVFRAGFSVDEFAPRVPRRLRRIVAKCLLLDPAARHQSLDELTDELAQCRWLEDQVESYIDDALELQKQGRVVEAYDRLDAALEVEPGSPAIHHARARIYFLEGEYRWALKQNQIAFDIERTWSVCALQAQAHLSLGESEPACRFARMAMRQEESSTTHHILARCLEQSGADEEALEHYQLAYEFARQQRAADADLIRSALEGLKSRLGKSSAAGGSA